LDFERRLEASAQYSNLDTHRAILCRFGYSGMISTLYVVWVGLSAYLGWRKGLWVALVSLVGMLVAYAATLIWGRAFGEFLAGYGFSGITAYVAGYTGVYVLVYALVVVLPRILLKKQQGNLALAGAILGTVTGALSGLVVVWALSFLAATASVSPRALPPKVTQVIAEPAVVKTVAGKVMGGAVNLGSQALGADRLQADIAQRFVESPDKTLQTVQSLGQSEQLRRFLANDLVRQALNRGNAYELRDQSAFQSLVELPALGELRQLVLARVQQQDPQAGLQDADLYVAERITTVWQRTQKLRNRPEVRAILEDREVQQLIEQQNIVALMRHPKVQQLIPLVADGSKALGPGSEQSDTAESGARIYQWRDEQGQVHFSDSPPGEQSTND